MLRLLGYNTKVISTFDDTVCNNFKISKTSGTRLFSGNVKSKRSERQLVWVISDGIPGHENRCLSLAKEMHCNVVVKKLPNVKVLNFLPMILRKYFIDLFSLDVSRYLKNASKPWYFRSTGEEKDKISSPYPDTVISCGKETVMASLEIKKILDKKATFIHLGHPGIPFGHFDSVVLQKHELFQLSPVLSQQKNIISTPLALHQITPRLLTEARSKAETIIGENFTKKDSQSPIVGLLVGNIPTDFKFYNQHVKSLAGDLEMLVKKYNVRLLVSYSSRTPSYLKSQLDPVLDSLTSEGYPIKKCDHDDSETYKAILSTATHLLVTLGSVNFLSEAIATRKPVYVIGLDQSQGGLAALGQRAINQGWARQFRVSPRYRPPGDPLSYIGEHSPFNPFPSHPSIAKKVVDQIEELLSKQKA